VRVGSLFSGIGGFDLGLERAGFTVAWQCEADEFCRRVLAKHWPSVPCHPDVRTLGADTAEPVDVLCGGFPCQDISVAGRGVGIDGARSGLWADYARLVRELRPRYVLVENVPALLARGLGRVLGDLAACGYNAEWDCISASAFGAPHRRNRLWIVAYPGSARRRQDAGGASRDEAADEGRAAQHDHVAGCDGEGDGARHVADALSRGRPAVERALLPRPTEPDLARRGTALAHSHGEQAERASVAWDERDPWATEPAVDRVVDGLPGRVDRVTALGNALVPQIAEWLGQRILEYERGLVSAA
jgi:DNA (cytosine-5)-methyltransferase 1